VANAFTGVKDVAAGLPGKAAQEQVVGSKFLAGAGGSMVNK
jgi:hypothetical protein